MTHLQVPIAIAFACLLVACGETRTAAPPELQNGVQMMRKMLSPMRLSQSMYSLQQDGKASTFVNFQFSSLGAAEWPDSEEMAEHEPALREQAKAIGIPLSPKGVAFVPDKPNPAQGKQIVLRADDTRSVVIIEAYLDPAGKAVIVEEIPLPQVKAGNEAVIKALREGSRGIE